jgi:hypothetical protein
MSNSAWQRAGAAAFALAVCLLFGGRAAAGEEWVVRGESKNVDGQIPVVFWADDDHTRYAPLPDNVKPEALLKGAKLAGVPPGWTVEQVKLEAKVEKRSQSPGARGGASWDAYVLSGTWKVTVPRDCAEGEYNFSVQFPAVQDYAEEVGANGVPTAIPLKVKVFATADALRKEDVKENTGSIFAIVALAVVAVLGIGGVIVWWKLTRG